MGPKFKNINIHQFLLISYLQDWWQSGQSKVGFCDLNSELCYANENKTPPKTAQYELFPVQQRDTGEIRLGLILWLGSRAVYPTMQHFISVTNKKKQKFFQFITDEKWSIFRKLSQS